MKKFAIAAATATALTLTSHAKENKHSDLPFL
jgi:hypothetical protein